MLKAKKDKLTKMRNVEYSFLFEKFKLFSKKINKIINIII